MLRQSPGPAHGGPCQRRHVRQQCPVVLGQLGESEARVQDGVVKEVRFVAGPAVFYEAVRSAMMKYRCSSHSAMVIAVQEFNFRIN